MSVPVDKFVSQIAEKLGLSVKQPNLICKIVIATMLLPDIGPLFSALSIELPQQLLVKFFFESFVQEHLTTQQFRRSVSLQTSHEHKFKFTGQRAKPTNSTEFQHRFSAALKTVLNVDATDADLCRIANSYFMLNNQMKEAHVRGMHFEQRQGGAVQTDGRDEDLEAEPDRSQVRRTRRKRKVLQAERCDVRGQQKCQVKS
ncbi:Hypothetical_protein [Hexamita inflata]|uniref:Hypothetical_protein n=1 Tax=Hexamita inflata TaxID=28002 RepID=A0AA86UQR7_9EUKA|nr:Hypothetical protein HINF_LOCUS48541 [Hexamita inflata]